MNLLSNLDKVQEFIDAFDASHDPELWFSLIVEELNELQVAIAADDKIEIADAGADIEYVCNGMILAVRRMMVARAIPWQRVFDEVHRSNMTKLNDEGKPIKREDGKILKGPNYEPPRIAAILEPTDAA